MASTPAAGNNDGVLTLWIEETQMETMTTLDTDTGRVDQIQFGQMAVPSSWTSGTEYFDLYEAHRTSYIGPDASAPTPPAPPTKTDALFADTFESGGTSNWSVVTTTGGDLSVSTQAAVTGTYGLKLLQDDTTADYLTDYRPWDETQYRARFYLKTNNIFLKETTPLYIFKILNADGVDVAHVALQNSSGDYQVKAEARNDAGVYTAASTNWFNLWDGLHYIEINWQAATADGANNGVLTLWVDETQQATFTTIDNDTYKIDQAQLGAISGMDATNYGTLTMDLFESRRSTQIGAAAGAPAPQTTALDVIYLNGFETGNFNGWSANTPNGTNLSVTTASKIAGTYGMQAAASSSTTSIFVTDKRSSGETQYRARFYFNPNSVVIADTNSHYLLYAQQGTSSPVTILRLEFRKSLGDYQVRASAYDDASAWQSTQWYSVANQMYYFEVNWKAATAVGANNGVLTLWMDGTQKETLTTLDTDTRRVDQIQLGQMSPQATTTGTEYFDLYESRRTSYIGPDAGAPTPPAMPTPPLAADAIFSDGLESGSFSAWSANTPNSGGLTVTTGSKNAGTYGLSAYINNNTSEYVTDWSPWLEPHYRAEFMFNPNGITMATNDAHYIFYAISHDGLVVARVEFYKNASGYQIRAGAVTDASSSTFVTLTGTTTAVTNAWHKIEIEWKAATAAGANNGVLTLWVDGTQISTVTNLDNDTRRVDGAQLGPVYGIDTGTRGTEYFDTFISRRTTQIGMALPTGEAVASNERPVQTQTSQIIPVVYHPAWLLKPVEAPALTQPAAAAAPLSYAYDPLGRLTYADYGGGVFFQYTYDAVGNRLSETTQAGTTTFTYDAANRIATVNGVTYNWDNNGNLLSDGTSTYTYDHANHLKSVTTGGTTYTYAYNGLGDRVSQTVVGVTTRYTLDLNAGLAQVLADGTNTYLYGNERIAQYSGTSPTYFLGDALDSVRQITDATGSVILMRTYKPFGEVLSSSGSGSSGFGFTGEWVDNSTNLIYLRSRFYNPVQGRFLSKDPWSGNETRPLTLNPYQYGLNSPITNTDPSGRVCILGFDVNWIPGKNCDDHDRSEAVKTIQYYSGFITSPNFAKGFLFEVVDSLAVVGPEVTRIVLNKIVENNSQLKKLLDSLAIYSAIECNNNGPFLLLNILRNGVQGDQYFTSGRAFGRLTVIFLSASEITISLGSAAITAAASPLTFGLSLGATAVSATMSAYGALVLGSVVVKELNDHLLFSAFTGYKQNPLPGMEGQFPSVPGWEAEDKVSEIIGVHPNRGSNRKILQEDYFTSKTKTRIPDFDPSLTPGKIVEVKDRDFIWLDPNENLPDFIEYARKNSLKVELWYRGTLDSSLLKLSEGDNAIIILRKIP